MPMVYVCFRPDVVRLEVSSNVMDMMTVGTVVTSATVVTLFGLMIQLDAVKIEQSLVAVSAHML